MSVSQVRCQLGSSPVVRPRWIKDPFTSFGPWAKPRPPMALLTTSATERCRSHQGLSCICPTIRMGVMGVVDLKIVIQARFKILGRIEITALEKTPRQDAKPQFHLVEIGRAHV